MKPPGAVASRRRKWVLIVPTLLIIGAFFRWEIKDVTDAETGKQLVNYTGPAFPWQPCGPGRVNHIGKVKFTVRHWVCYGFIRLKSTGETYVINP